MSDSDCYGWAWGDYVYEKNLAVFSTESTAGGHKCKYCKCKFGKRWDVVRRHIRTSHKNVTAEALKRLNNPILKVATRGKNCKIPQLKQGAKFQKHEDKCKVVKNMDPKEKEKEYEKEKEIEQNVIDIEQNVIEPDKTDLKKQIKRKS